MAEIKKPITIATLGAAIVALLASAKGTGLEPAVAALNDDFTAFGKQPAVKDLSSDLTQAKEVIAELKARNAELTEEKAAIMPKNIIEINKVKYVVNHGAYPHSVEDIVSDPELAKTILKIAGQNAITKL